MKYLLAVIIFLFFGCTKSEDNGPIVSGEQVSGKLKLVVTSLPNRKAEVMRYVYDAQDRVIEWQQWDEDTTTNGVQKSDELNTYFIYSYNDDKPAKDSSTYNGAYYSKSYYSYDGNNRVFKEDMFRSSDNQNPYIRNLFSYGNGWIERRFFLRQGSGSTSTLPLNWYDTSRINASGAVYQANVYYPSSAQGSSTYEYDNKNNPFKNLNFIKHLISVGGDRSMLMFRGPNNVAKHTMNPAYSAQRIYSMSYTKYSSNGYPLTAITTYPVPSGTGVQYVTGNVRFEYY